MIKILHNWVRLCKYLCPRWLVSFLSFLLEYAITLSGKVLHNEIFTLSFNHFSNNRQILDCQLLFNATFCCPHWSLYLWHWYLGFFLLLILIYDIRTIVIVQLMLLLRRLWAFQVLYCLLIKFVWMNWLGFLRIFKVCVLKNFLVTWWKRSLWKMVLVEWWFTSFWKHQALIILSLSLFRRRFIFLLIADSAWMDWYAVLRIKNIVFLFGHMIWKDIFGVSEIGFALWILAVMDDGAVLEWVDFGLNFALFLIDFNTTRLIVAHFVSKCEWRLY